MAKLADAPDLGSGSERSEGSSPFIRTIKSNCKKTGSYQLVKPCFLD